jgi:polyisoprenoid-binding protein YceI
MHHMTRPIVTACLLAVATATLPATAQTPTQVPGQPDAKRVTAGTYKIDSAHAQVAFVVNHLGFNAYHGIFGDPTGTLTIDPANPSAAKVDIEIPMSGITTTSAKLTEHLKTPDFFDAAKFPTARFQSTSVTVNGTSAKIAGNLTIKGVTKPVTLDAKFIGAGKGPMNQAETIGFEATTSISRSAFGVSYGVPFVSDEVPLQITVAFEKAKA